MPMPQLTFRQHGLGVLCNFAYVYSMSSNLQCLGDYQKLLAGERRRPPPDNQRPPGAKPPDKVTESLSLSHPFIISPVWWHGSGHLERRPFWGHHNFLSSPRDARKRFDDPFGFARGRRAEEEKIAVRFLNLYVCMYLPAGAAWACHA
jgi:hypothetical protein